MDAKRNWLANNPCTNALDASFLMEKEGHFMKSCLAAEEESKAAAQNVQNGM
jgi:hypothetical protein